MSELKQPRPLEEVFANLNPTEQNFVSNCCNAPIVPESIDVCSDCKEHCEPIVEEE